MQTDNHNNRANDNRHKLLYRAVDSLAHVIVVEDNVREVVEMIAKERYQYNPPAILDVERLNDDGVYVLEGKINVGGY